MSYENNTNNTEKNSENTTRRPVSIFDIMDMAMNNPSEFERYLNGVQERRQMNDKFTKPEKVSAHKATRRPPCPISMFNDCNRLITTNIREEGNLVFVMMELAGFKKENIEINYVDGMLCVRAERELSDDYAVSEMSPVKVRNIFVGRNHTMEDFKSSFENGILRITINNAPEKNNAGRLNID